MTCEQVSRLRITGKERQREKHTEPKGPFTGYATGSVKSIIIILSYQKNVFNTFYSLQLRSNNDQHLLLIFFHKRF